MIDKSARISSLLGTLIVTFIATLLLANTILFAVGIPLMGLTVPLAGIIAIGVGAWLSIRTFKENRLTLFILIITFYIIVIVLVLINSSIYDISFDGQTYHSEAIIGLANGWNPLRMPVPANAFYRDWIGFFSKGAWITAAAMYRFTENIESGKVF